MAENPDSTRPNRVRELRENRLMTQAQLARKARVALRTIHSVEKGMNCRMDTKRKILLALGLRFEDKDQVFPPLRSQVLHALGGNGAAMSVASPSASAPTSLSRSSETPGDPWSTH
jgi:DNA-binding XRE family transcriptional regulator